MKILESNLCLLYWLSHLTWFSWYFIVFISVFCSLFCKIIPILICIVRVSISRLGGWNRFINRGEGRLPRSRESVCMYVYVCTPVLCRRHFKRFNGLGLQCWWDKSIVTRSDLIQFEARRRRFVDLSWRLARLDVSSKSAKA